METDQALAAFAALSQPTRLAIVQRLVGAGPEPMSAGRLSHELNVRPNTLSANLTVLLNAGLVSRTRRGREMLYSADTTGLQGLIGFLLKDCCGGRPELCQPAIEAAAIAS